MATWPCWFGPMVAQCIMEGAHAGGGLFSSWKPRSKVVRGGMQGGGERERDRQTDRQTGVPIATTRALPQ
jgi:hypothetical protein